jgi:hypothetical protein
VGTDTLADEKLMFPTTCTSLLSPSKPGDDAVIVAAPKLTPVTCGCTAGVVALKGMKTSLGVMMTFEGSLLASVTVTPPKGAPVAKLTGNGADWFGPTVTPAGSTICPDVPTPTFTVPVLYPGELAAIVADPTATPVRVKPPVVLPPEIGTLTGCTLTMPPGVAVSVTIKLEGAGVLRVMTPFIVLVSPTTAESSVTVISGKDTFTVAVPGPKPGTVAVIVVEPLALPGVTVMLAAIAPSGTVTVAGTVAMLVLLLVRLTVWPPTPASAGNIRIRLPGVVSKFRTFWKNKMAPEAVEIVTVAGSLLMKPLFTMSCTTYIPATSATNVGDTVLAPESVAVLPAGRVVNDQAYVRGS